MNRDWALAVLAPLLVAGGLLGLHNVWAVFLGYHCGLCLVVPAVVVRRENSTWLEFLRRLGLGRKRLGLGLALGIGLATIPPLAFVLAPQVFPDATQLRAVLAAWGVDPAAPAAVLLFLALVNGPAEELFWRGYLQDRLLRGPGSAVVLVLLFASYHVLTVGALAPGRIGIAVMLVGVLAAAAFWTWSRRRWDSLWPALLSHTGATVGYVAVSWRILGELSS